MQTKRKAVVTGGAGFIGSNLAEELLSRGFAVEVVDDLSGGIREKVPAEAVFHQTDILDSDALRRIFAGATYVFHLAARPRVPYSIEHPQETHRVNADGTLSVLVAARDAGVRRVVYSASSSAYGDQATLPLREDMPPAPVHPYGLQKYIGEEYCRLFSSIYGLSTVSLRYFNVYGPKLNPDGAYALVVGVFLKERQRGEPLTIVGDGEQTRDFTHVRDVVRANILAAESARVGKGEVLNIGGGRNVTVNHLANLFGGERTHTPARIEAKDSLADISKARELLGWEPTIRLEDGVVELKQLFGIA